MDELFIHIGKLYVDTANMQKYIEVIRTQIVDKDKEIQELKKQINDINGRE